MYTLDTFYKSKKWQRLVALIRQERVGEDGFLRCEHCGKPIVRAYDCIGHHTIPLTEQNVNDYSISLNPDRIMLVHHKCHNTLHNKLGRMARTVYLVYGPPLSGKSSWVASVQEPGDLVVDMERGADGAADAMQEAGRAAGEI